MRRMLLLAALVGLAVAPACRSASKKAQAGESATGASEPAEGPFTGFADDAFPPTLPADEMHADAWLRDDCLLCHQTGVRGAPVVQHVGMPRALLDASCRTCHVPGDPGGEIDEETGVAFARNAFPPSLPDDGAHENAWLRDDCLTCHEQGLMGSPRVVHRGMPQALLDAQCRSCHLPGVEAGRLDMAP